MEKFPSIDQFRHCVKRVQRKAEFTCMDAEGQPMYDHLAIKPKLRFRGYVKLHGTNAGIVFSDQPTVFQSRERELTAESDNAGFYAHMTANTPSMADLRIKIAATFGYKSKVAVYGEWCGRGIQKGVGISELEKMFIIFAIAADDEWMDIELIGDYHSHDANIYTISAFAKYDVLIDFENPSEAQNEMVKITEAVELCCPVAQALGAKGIGEGVVWHCVEPGMESSDYWFKVKGEKHSESHVKTLSAVDIELANSVAEFVARTVTTQRLEHALQNLTNEQQKPFEMQSIGDFLRWVFNDILKEESDTITASGIDSKKLGGPISIAAKRWFIERLNIA